MSEEANTVESVETPDAGATVETSEIESEAKEEESTTSADEQTEASDDESGKDTDDVKPKLKGVQKRFDELTREKYDEKRKRELAEQKLAELQKQVAETKPATDKPKLDDFETLEEFNEALFDWKLAERERATNKDSELRSKADQSAEHQATVEASVDYLLKAGTLKYPDFQTVAGSVPPSVMTDDLLLALADIETGADVAYHLGKNPADAARLINLSPVQLGRALASIEANLQSAPKKTPTQTAEPIKPAGNRASVDKDPTKMTDNEFAEWRRKQIAKRS